MVEITTVIRRTNEDRKRLGYTTINPRIITDTSLSKNARLLYVYALTKPNDWKFNATYTARELLGKEDRKAISKALEELRNKGLAIGRFSYKTVIFLEKPYREMTETERKTVDDIVKNLYGG